MRIFHFGSFLRCLLPWKQDSNDGSGSCESSQKFELDTSKETEMAAEYLSSFSLGRAQVCRARG